jgi:signal transduction histidine kinase
MRDSKPKIAKIFTNLVMHRLDEPFSHTSHNKTRTMVEVIFIGTFIVLCCLMLILTLSILVFHNTYVVSRLLIGLCVLCYLLIVWLLIKRQRLKIASWLLIFLYTLVASSILIVWGINAPVGVLMLAFVIFLSSVMLGPRYIIPVTLGVVILLISLQFLNLFQIVNPDKSPLSIDSSFGDVATYGTIFGVYALIAWIAGNQREQALLKTMKAEAALEKEKDFLEVRLEERTQLLMEAQMQEIRQLYRFAGLGQLTTMILHELANNLSVLNLDIDDLKQRHKHLKSIDRLQESIDYMDNLVEQVRNRLKESGKPVRFNSLKIVRESIKTLEVRASKSNVILKYENADKARSFYIVGDPLRLSQTIIILINNAIDAYGVSQSSDARVVVTKIKHSANELSISIIDYGPGVPQNIRANLFKPLHTTKENGLGIGLFIAREVIENHFKGTLKLGPSRDRTEFIIKLFS